MRILVGLQEWLDLPAALLASRIYFISLLSCLLIDVVRVPCYNVSHACHRPKGHTYVSPSYAACSC
jgi:hypothetical protein